MKNNQCYFVYLARCKDDALYIGKTTNLEKRINTHNQNRGAKFIAKHGEAKIVYFEKYNDNTSACRREKQIKKWSRIKKENLIKYNQPSKF